MIRILPDRWLSRRAADQVTLSQDVIEICADLFELAYRVDALAKPTSSDPATSVVVHLHTWDAQRAAVKELEHAKSALGAVRRRLQSIEGKGFR
jgi:hypothetical protein